MDGLSDDGVYSYSNKTNNWIHFNIKHILLLHTNLLNYFFLQNINIQSNSHDYRC